ncbi:DUF3421 domain-containing protein [Actinoplanes derwentensis]|uniref:Uncharacterized protein n=1 Tax=Actinoplanes derwentensis TaxID=113562 RepID=A0A1H1X5R8_9ACTN|nr:DUF3421 domain-containing protein [Actinoplanes derwentensis]GID85713.1 hypothetical protein Ade03nite_46370 [Actinoplanes derwentensis]SDT04411.1 Protein of unknown function [Actinoplanes derwentensis]
MAFEPNRSVPHADGYRWVPASNGQIPAGAIPHGYEEDGTPLWLCRAHMHGGLHPGKVRPGLGMAGIAWGGEELGVRDYEVLMDRGVWGIADGGDVPDEAYQVGWESSGEPLYAARAAVEGSNLQLGKLRPAFQGANIGYGDDEHVIHAYEVLLSPSYK